MASVAGREPEPSRRAAASKPRPGAGTLVVVATPIGNARDITLRALEVLASADLIACEDTRVTGPFLTRHGVATPLTPYHDHNAPRVRPRLMALLKRGETVALVSDAGTPLVSDPGYKLVRACIDEGIPVTGVPGASAVLAALVVSGLPTDRFLFAGFLGPGRQARRRALTELARVPATLVVMESARRLADLLADMAAELGPRPAAVTRELTKMFEEVRRGPLAELAAHYRAAGPPKGEITVVVAPPPAAAAPTTTELDERLRGALTGASLSDAVARVAAETGLPRRRVYARALELGREKR